MYFGNLELCDIAYNLEQFKFKTIDGYDANEQTDSNIQTLSYFFIIAVCP